MSLKNYKWFKVADSRKDLLWQDNNLLVTEAGGKKFTLARVGEDLFACARKCPHASGFLADGFIDSTGNIVCPLHRYKFDLRNGRNVSGEGYFLKVYLIEERIDGIFVGFEETSWKDFLK